MTSPEPSPGSWHFTVVRMDSFIRGGSFWFDGEPPSYAHMPFTGSNRPTAIARCWGLRLAALELTAELWEVSALGR